MNTRHKQFGPFGFTLIELLVAATIMILLTTIGLVSYQNANRNGRNAKRKADITTVQQALVLYRTDNGTYPTGNGSAAAFTTAVNTVSDYLSSTDLEDPKSPTYDYVYTGTTSTFSVCATLELPNALTEDFCVHNP
jgi:type II secretory pathway pseudopilin PulG